MVKSANRLSRFAFTMIELIFAIVIIGISVVSLPMMSLATSKGVENSIVQEAIFAASAELMGASAGYWDLRSMDDNNFSAISRVIDISGDCNALRLRPGHIAQLKHRRCLDSNVSAANTSSVAFVNLNNAAHNDAPIFLNPSGGGASGYKDDYTSAVAVVRAGNIKTITITIKNSDPVPKTIVLLRMQSANIGEVDYDKRSF